MINLLPPQTKKELRSARLNVILLRYCIFLVICVVFLVGIFGVGFYITDIDAQAAQKKRAESQRKINQYSKVKAEAEAFSGNLANAKTILSSEVVFSKLITDIAGVLPSGAILGSLNLTSNTLGAPISLQAKVTTNAKAIELKDKLEASTLFEKVSIVSIQVSEVSDSGNSLDRSHPVGVTLNAVLSKPTTTPTGASKP